MQALSGLRLNSALVNCYGMPVYMLDCSLRRFIRFARAGRIARQSRRVFLRYEPENRCMRVVSGHDRVRACRGRLPATVSVADSRRMADDTAEAFRRAGIVLV